MTDAPEGRPWYRFGRPGGFAYVAALVTAWALLANFGRIGFPAQAFDEPFYAQAAWRYIHGDHNTPPTGITSNFDNFEHPPLAKYLFGLAQLVAGHPSVVADRVVATLCTLGTAAVLGGWIGRLAGRWVGLGAAGLVALLPMSVPDVAFRFGRYGYLDPVAELFAVSSVVLAWVWFRRTGRSAWWYAVATGACVGLAAASKENGFLGAVGPVLVGLMLAGRDLRAIRRRLLQAAAAVGASVLVFAATYLGFAHPVAAFRFMLRYQQEHAKLGHRVEFAGRVAQHPPGWAFLWFAEHGIGTVISVLCLIAVAAAIALRHDRLVLWCVAALGGPLLFHMLIARVVLSFYWVMWMPAFLALVALGVGELARLALERAQPGLDVGLAAGVVATFCVAAFASTAADDTHRMLTRPVTQHRTVTYAAGVTGHAPLVYLRLGEASGDVATDSSSQHHDGFYVGRPALGATGLLTGDSDRAARFNGSDQYAELAAAPWMNVPDYSVVVWFSGTATSRYLVSRDDYNRSKVWDVLVDAAGRVQFLTFSTAAGAGQRTVSAHAYNDGRPHMVVATKSGTTMQLFVDGTLVSSAQFGTFVDGTSGPDIDLARRGNGAGYYAGTIDEFAFLAKPLTPLDVLGLYRAGTGS